MKTFRIIYYLLLGIVLTVQSQDPNPVTPPVNPTPLQINTTTYQTTNVTTDPETPWSTLPSTNSKYKVDPGNLYKMDWMQNKFNWYKPNTPGGNIEYFVYPDNKDLATGVTSPFGTGLNYLPGISTSDPANSGIFPSEGWELIKQDFGYLNNDNSGGDANANIADGDRSAIPYIILYNKFQGILRVVGYSKNQTANFERVRLSLDSKNFYSTDITGNKTYNHFTGLLNNYGNTATALDQPASIPDVSVFAIKSPDISFGNPFVADFNLAYDPCTCFLSSGIVVEFSDVDQSSLTAISTSQIDKSSLPNFYASVLTGQLDQNNNTSAHGGILTFVSNDDLANRLTTLASSQQSDGLDPSVSEGLKGVSAALAVASAVTIELPVVSGALLAISLIVDFFSGVADASPSASPTFGAIAGTITKIYNPYPINIALPGSQATIDVTASVATHEGSQSILTDEYFQGKNNSFKTNYPIYNEALGTFALLKTPVINVYSAFNISDNSIEDYKKHVGTDQPDGYTNIGFQVPANTDNIKFTFNPALKITNYNIRAAIKVDRNFDNDSGNVPTLSKSDYLQAYFNPTAAGQQTISYITPYVDLKCIESITPDFRFLQFNGVPSYTDYSLSTTNPFLTRIDNFTFYLKLIVAIDFDNGAGQTKSSILLLTYPLKINPVSSDPSSNNKIVTDDLALGTQNFATSQTLNAWHTASIIGNLTDTDYRGNHQPITIQAGEEIIQSGESVINGEFVMQIGEQNGGNCNPLLIPVSPTEITNFCKGTGNLNYVYKANTPSFTPVARQEAEANNIAITKPSPVARQFGTPNIAAIPNPTNGQVTFYYKMPTDGEVSIAINNILGTKIADVIKNEFKSTGQYQKQLDLSQLAVGVYMVTIETNGYKQTERLVISR